MRRMSGRARAISASGERSARPGSAAARAGTTSDRVVSGCPPGGRSAPSERRRKPSPAARQAGGSAGRAPRQSSSATASNEVVAERATASCPR